MPPTALILPSSLNFLKLVKKNNNRDWFSEHKERYLSELSQLETFASALLTDMNRHDVIETASGRASLHRIYRDTRFSKDKTPYKTNWSGSFSRAGKARRGSYYFHIEPGNSFVSGGFWGPNPPDLKLIRDELAWDATPLRTILESKSFKSTFGSLQGEQLKTAPKGYDPAHPAIDLLRYKQFLLRKRFTDAEVLSADFVHKASAAFKAMRPFLDFMSEVLSTDANGQ